MRSVPQCICRIGCDVVSCVSPQNNVCDDEYVEQYQKYDVGYHVCYPIECVKEWAQYRNMWYLSIGQCEINDIYVAHPHIIQTSSVLCAVPFRTKTDISRSYYMYISIVVMIYS